MRLKTKFMVVLMSMVMSALAFTGCTNKTKPDAVSSKVPEVKTEASATPTNSDDPFNITAEPVTYKFAAALPSNYGNPAEKQFFKDLEEKTKVHIEWEYFPIEVKDEKVGVLLASNDLPDAFYTHNNFTLDQANTYGMQGTLIDLTNLIKQNAPHIDNAYTVSEAWDNLKAGDEKMYILGQVAYGGEKQGVVHTENFINAKWLKNVGMESPTTTEEYHEVLKAFKEKDADGDGNPNNEIPLSYGPMYGYGAMLPGAFGYIDSGYHMEYDGEKYFPIANTDNYKEFVKYMNKLYTEGLIDKEVFSHDDTQFRGKGTAQQIGSFVDYGGWNIVGGMTPLKDGTYEPMQVLAGPQGIKRTQNMFSPIRSMCDMAITNSCENPETLIKWVDLFYNDDLMVEFEHTFGPQGINFEITDDGKLELLPTPEGMAYGVFRASQTVPQGPGYFSQKMSDMRKSLGEMGDYKVKIDEEYGYIENATNPVAPILSFTIEETEELIILRTDVEDYIKEFEAACIVGQKDIETEWESFKKQLEKYGYSRMVEIYNTALARK